MVMALAWILWVMSAGLSKIIFVSREGGKCKAGSEYKCCIDDFQHGWMLSRAETIQSLPLALD